MCTSRCCRRSCRSFAQPSVIIHFKRSFVIPFCHRTSYLKPRFQPFHWCWKAFVFSLSVSQPLRCCTFHIHIPNQSYPFFLLHICNRCCCCCCTLLICYTFHMHLSRLDRVSKNAHRNGRCQCWTAIRRTTQLMRSWATLLFKLRDFIPPLVWLAIWYAHRTFIYNYKILNTLINYCLLNGNIHVQSHRERAHSYVSTMCAHARTHLPAAQFCMESSQDLSDLDDHLRAKLA